MKKVILSAALAFTFAYAGAQTNNPTANNATVTQEQGNNLGEFRQIQGATTGNILSAKQMNSADGVANEMTVIQFGSNNKAGRNEPGFSKQLLQNGSDNLMTVTQGEEGSVVSDNNRAMAEQVGDKNEMRVSQIGNNNFAGRGLKKLGQIGDDNVMDISQLGDMNRTYVEQKGIVESVENNNLSLIQEGNSNHFGFANNTSIQNGDNNKGTVDQFGDYNRGRLIQEGNSNFAIMNQGNEDADANYNKAFVTSIGDHNAFRVTQEGTLNSVNTLGFSETGLVGQSGQNNKINIAQSLSSNTATLKQMQAMIGSYNVGNKIKSTQHSKGSILEGTQIGSGNEIFSVQRGLEYNKILTSQDGTENFLDARQTDVGGKGNMINAKFGGENDMFTTASNSKLTQRGSFNQLGLTVSGGGNKSTVLQKGQSNHASSENTYVSTPAASEFFSTDANFTLGLVQEGDVNKLDLLQNGNFNEAGISQIGNDLNAKIVQQNNNNFGVISQSGASHDASLMQNGCNNEAIIYQTK